MCNKDSGNVTEHSAQSLGNRRFGMDIECRECVVENQNARPGQNRPGQRQPLTLATGQTQPLLTNAGLQAEGQFVDELRSGDLEGAF
jgi:hypothetical protein